jgi:putative ABC transport system permease protein
MNTIGSDIRFAVRSLSKSKLFTVVALLSLALGIGANVTVFALVNAIAFKPLPFAEPDALVDLHEWSATKLCGGCAVGTSFPTFMDWRANARSFTALGAYIERPFNVSGTETAERIGGALVSAETFDLLGVHPPLGRGFTADDDRVGAAPVVLLSDGLFARRYGADRRIIGQTIRVNGVAHTVIGVMPPRFKFPEFADLWVPFVPNATGGARDQRDFGVVARLRPGISLANADGEMIRIAKGLEEKYPETQKEWTSHATSLRSEFAGIEKSLYAVMLGAVGFVLLIVCANLAGLLLARGAGRQKEIAIRLALGATRTQIVRHLLTEALLLSCAGGALGMLVASWGVDLTQRGFRQQVPAWLDFGIDSRVLVFSVAVTVATGLLFGLLPALRASTPDVHIALKEGTLTVRRSHVRGLLVIGELALALILLAGAGDLMKSFVRISARPEGTDERGLLTGKLEFLDAKYHDPAAILLASNEILARLHRLPGATAATIDRIDFIAGFGGHDQTIQAEGVASIPSGASPRFYHVVTPDYLPTVRLPLLAGRNLTASDRSGAERVALLNKHSAGLLWPDASPIGKHIKLGPADSLPWVTVVGIVGDVSERGRARDYAYVPFAQSPGGPVDIFVRTNGDPLGLTNGVRAAVREVDPDLPIVSLMTVEQQHNGNYSPYKVYAMSMAVFAAFAIILAAIGLYGVIAYNTAQRTREIGVRIALGAEAKHVLGLVAAQGTRLVVAGIILGLGGSFLVLRVIQSMLFGASPIDVPIFAGVSTLLATIALVAVWIPARRATRVDPIEALRAE